jgi:hypothetical protein
VSLGKVVPFGDDWALGRALDRALSASWDRQAIRAYAVANSWESRVAVLVDTFRALAEDGRLAVGEGAS